MNTRICWTFGVSPVWYQLKFTSKENGMKWPRPCMFWSLMQGLAPHRSCCIESRKSWIVTATWPQSTTCCPRSLRTCPMRHWSVEQETSLFSSPRPNLLGRQLPNSKLRSEWGHGTGWTGVFISEQKWWKTVSGGDGAGSGVSRDLCLC